MSVIQKPTQEDMIKTKGAKLMSKVRCNMCMEVFESDDDLIFMEDKDGHYKGCETCKTDGYLMDIEEKK